MVLDFLTTFEWVIWLALILAFGIVEVVTVQFFFVMLAVGSLGGLIGGLAGLPWWAQIVVAAVVSVLLIFAVRPPLLRALKRGGDPALSNVDALIGLAGTITTDFTGNPNHVKLSNGETWTARLVGDTFGDDRALVDGERVTVIAIEGATAMVQSAERTAS